MPRGGGFAVAGTSGGAAMKQAQVVLASVLAGALLVGFPMKGPALPAVERVDRSSAPLLAGVDRAWWATIRSSIQSVNRFGWKVVGDQRNALFGWSVGTAGDVNGDGYDDAIVGAYQYSNGQTDEGRAFVYYGSASGLSLTANWTAEGDQANAYFGTSVGTAGDVNGDGFDDVIVGAPDYTIGQTGEGRAYVYLGGADGLSLTPVWTAEGDQTYGHFGGSVGTAGDVNGDGFDDIIVGSPYYDNGMCPMWAAPTCTTGRPPAHPSLR